MMPGPKRKPTTIDKLEGNPSKRKRSPTEPRPSRAPRVPACPAYLKGESRREWGRIAGELHVLGLLTVIDRAALEGYCIGYQMVVESTRELDRMQRTYKEMVKLQRKDPKVKLASNGMVAVTSNGNTIMEPMLSVRKQGLEIMHKFLTEFGMTPSSRARLTVETKKDDDPMEEFLGSNRSN